MLRTYADTHLRTHGILPRSFYLADPLTVARNLLGCRLVRQQNDSILSGMIIETESYHGLQDSASHARFGKTARNSVLFEEAGHAYVYFIYGMYSMLNIVTGGPGDACAVLLRAVVPLTEQMLAPRTSTRRIADGPGRLCRYFNVDRSLNGWDLTIGKKLWLEQYRQFLDSEVDITPRIGINYARPEDRASLRRFRVKNRKTD